MGVQINGTNDTISDSDSGFSLGGTNNRLRLYGATSGYVEISAHATSASNTLTLPTGNGSSGQYLQTNGAGALSWQTVTDTTGWTWDTTGTALSGSSVTVTGIPSTARKVIVNYRDLDIDAAYNWFVRGGTSGGLSSTNYTVKVSLLSGTTINTTYFDNGFYSYGFANTNNRANGVVVLDKMDGYEWVGYSFIEQGLASSASNFMVGSMVLSGDLDRIGLVMASGNFDGGRVFVHYLEP